MYHNSKDELNRMFAPRWMFPIYGALHLLPTLIFKPTVALKTPLRTFLRAAWGTTRSSAFLGIFVVIYQGTAVSYLIE